MERRLDINLLPPEFRPQPAVRWHPIYLAVLYSLAIVLLLYLGFSSMNRVKALEGRISKAEQEIGNLKVFADAYDAAERSVRSLDNLKRLFVYLDQHYVDWPLFFHHLEPNLPKGVWISSVECKAVTTPPPKKKARQPAAEGAGKEAQGTTEATEAKEGGAKAPEPKAKEGYTAEGVPLHTGEIMLEGSMSGYDLMPLSILLKNLQNDPYFVEPYVLSSELIEDEDEGVTRTFQVVVRVTSQEPPAADEKDAAKGGGAA